MTKKKITKSKLSIKDKYQLYEDSVQCHEADIEFISKEYKKLFKKDAVVFREDFGGTAAMACDWVKLSPKNKAFAIDLDPEPVKYGKENHYSKLTDEEQSRMKYVMGNVLAPQSVKSDITVAFNFSYFIFKKRAVLLEYFKKVHKSLNKEGLFFLDLFGGSDCCEPLEEATEHDDHTYYWDCDKFNPITNEVLYYIHFKMHKDKVKHEQVFTYDWRMWTPMELREILEEAGFSESFAYWEGTDDDGTGDGNFYKSTDEENCESWVIYIGAKK
jgi:hypothetical protein